MAELEVLKRKVERERRARKQAEAVLEQKALELFHANQELQTLNEGLEKTIAERTKALQESELRYRQIIETASDMIYRLNADGIIIYVNPVASFLLGYEKEELIGRHYATLIEPSYRNEIVAFYGRQLQSRQKSSYYEVPLVDQQGEILWIGQNVQLIEKDGEVFEINALARDITERRLAENELSTTKQRLTSLIKNLQAGILVENEHHQIVLINERFCQLFGVKKATNELIGNSILTGNLPDRNLFIDPAGFEHLLLKLQRDRSISTQHELMLLNGRILSLDYIPIFAQNQYLGHLWKYEDITSQRIAEEKLRWSEEKYRGIIENMELGLLEVDNEGRIQQAYDRFCEMTGYTAEELVGHSANEILLPPEYREVMDKQNADRLKGIAGSYEVELRKKDGTLFWALLSGAPIFDERGQVVGSLGIHYDVTPQKKMQQDLQEAKMRAEAAQEAEKQFLANMSHEMRTPLNAIIGMTHLLSETNTSEDQDEYISLLKSSANILHALISDILDFSKIQAGEIIAQKKPFDLIGTLELTKRTFDVRLENKNVEMVLEVDPEIDYLVQGDDLLLNQVLNNLIGNAAKFTEKGSITLCVQQQQRIENQVVLSFQVIDTGIGIPDDKLDLIFQNFKQVSADIKVKYGGTGLGLAITKKIIELQGGSIRVESEVGRGSIFHFTLPYELAGSRQAEQKTDVFSTPLQLDHGKEVLVVEDNFMNQKYVSTLFKKWNVAYTIANNGKEGVELANHRPFDLILMDIQMPVMDGYAATEIIRNTENPNRGTPIVALTASGIIANKERGISLGMDDYLTKPFKPDLMHKVLQTYLSNPNKHKDLAMEQPSNFSFDPALDFDYLLEMYEMDLDYAYEMFDLFIHHSAQELPQIGAFMQRQDREAAKKLAHKLKPSFPMVGLPELGKKMADLEHSLSPEGDYAQAQTIYQEVNLLWEKYQPIIQKEYERLRKVVSPNGTTA